MSSLFGGRKAIEVSLQEYLEKRCPFRACEQNWDGECEEIDEHFLFARMNQLWELTKRATKRPTDEEARYTYFVCENHGIDPDICEFCGAPLKQVWEDRGEYWGAPCKEKMISCPQGCQ